MSRIHYAADVREAAVDLVLNSHVPAAQVAHEVGCSVFTIHSWVKKHRQQTGQPAEQPSKPTTFIPVNLIDAKPSAIEIVTPNGYTIRLSDVSSQSLIELFSALASC